MQHLILRCKHCGKEYTYCTYGNGKEYGTEEGCSMDYCSECQKAIDEALGKIKVKFMPKYRKIKEPLLFELFDKLRTNKQSNTLISLNEYIGDYDNAEYFIHNGKKFMVGWYDEKPDEKDIYISSEYDILNECFTDKIWKYDNKDTYYYSRNFLKNFKKGFSEKILNHTYKLPEPIGDLFYFEPVNTNTQKTIQTEEKQHILRKYTNNTNGINLKNILKNGWYKTSVTIAPNINTENIADVLDYEYTWEKYEDEDTAIITNIKCI